MGLRLYAGTSGWAYPTWKPGFYPAGLSSRPMLEHYAARLNSVEVNYTFRSLPTEPQLQQWIGAVPPTFRFSFKAPQAITHYKRLSDCNQAMPEFLSALEPVRAAGLLGCVLVQLPPNFKADHERLKTFLSLPEMQTADRFAFEFRHASWFVEDTWRLLRNYGAALCVAESEVLQTPKVHTAVDFACYRLRMPGGYAPGDLAQQAARFRELSGSREVYVYYKHEDEPTGPLAAEAMLRLAGGPQVHGHEREPEEG